MKTLYSVAAFLMMFFCLAVFVHADSVDEQYAEMYKKYPRELFIVGIGESPKTKNNYNDKRVAEVLARVEIAKQIKVRVKEESIDVVCEGKVKGYKSKGECQSSFSSIVEMTVDEFLRGSRIAETRELNNKVYAVAILARGEALSFLNEKVAESVEKSRKSSLKAKGGDLEAQKDADAEYRKALAFAMEKKALEGVRVNADKMFEELEKELSKVDKR